MIKHVCHYWFCAAVLVLYSVGSLANVVTGQASIPAGYYSSVDAKSSPDAILDALNARITNHTVIAYKNLEPYYQQTDFYNDTVWDMYSTCRFTAADANKSQNSVCDAWNKEHSIPQSWFNEQSPMKSDLFHVYPTDARVNNFRSNYPYGEVSGGNGAGFKDNYKGHGLGKLGSNTFSGYSGTVFEPADQYKGDFARTYFYMVARYRNNALNSSNGSAVFTAKKTNLTTYAKNLFLKWHRQDPVSQKEIDRNQAVYGIQKNRNPFIDYPELVEYIWGKKQGQAVDLASLEPTCATGSTPPTPPIDPDPPIDPEPPVDYDTYRVIWMVNGAVLRVDTVEEDEPIPFFPADPKSCSEQSETFVGWSSKQINGTTDKAPSDLLNRTDEEPVVNADITFYAVFAHKQAAQGEQTAKVNFSSYRRGYKPATVKAGEVSVTFDQDRASSPATMATELRCYPGSLIIFTGATITKVEWTAGANDNDLPIEVNTGELDTQLVWTGRTDSLVFSIGGDGKFRGFSAVTVTYTLGSGTAGKPAVVYNRYTTACDESGVVEQPEQAVEQTQASPAAYRKILYNGQLYILAGDQLYTLTGQRIR